MKIDHNDIDWLSDNYRGLKTIKKGERLIIEGELKFSARYNKETGKYIINPTIDDDFLINDHYQIRIETFLNSNKYPDIREVGGRILRSAKLYKKNPQDLHVYSGRNENLLCTVGPIYEQFSKSDNLLLKDLIEKILIPFFYDNSYYENNGVRLRQDYSHGVWGLIENYFEYNGDINVELGEFVKDKIKKSGEWEKLREYFEMDRKIQGHWRCVVCGGDKIKNCHYRVFRGIRKIQSDKIFKFKYY